MGEIFSPPAPPSPPPAPVVQTVNTGQTETEARLDAVERARRGMAGTIVTSDKGDLLQLQPQAARGKTLLGD